MRWNRSIILLAKLRAHFYTGNSICLYCATCGAAPGFEKSQSGKYSEIRDFVQGEFHLAAQVPIPDKVCGWIFQIQTYKVIESVKYKFEGWQYMKYLYLHGLGQKPDSWNRVIKETKESIEKQSQRTKNRYLTRR